MGVASVLWWAAAAAMIPAALRLRDLSGSAERAGLAGAAAMFLAVALGFLRPVPVPALAGLDLALAGLCGLALAGWLPALAAILHGGRLRPEVWLIASAGLGLLALAVMAGDLPMVFVAAPVAAQAASFCIGMAALGTGEASGRAG